MRHIGDPNVLNLEIKQASKEEKDIRLKQLAHDLLINLIIFRK